MLDGEEIPEMTQRVVRIPRGVFIETKDPREMERLVLAKLQEAGVPVYGIAFLVSLDRGELTVRKEMDGSLLYIWKD